MSLDGLRAWIGEVERKLGARTRVFLVLVAIAVGGAGASVYLAVEARNDQASKGDLESVEAATQAKVEALEARLSALEATPEPTEAAPKAVPTPKRR